MEASCVYLLLFCMCTWPPWVWIVSASPVTSAVSRKMGDIWVNYPFNLYSKRNSKFCGLILTLLLFCHPETRHRPMIAEPRHRGPKPPPASPDWAAAATRKPDPNPRVATFNPHDLRTNDSAERCSSCVRAGSGCAERPFKALKIKNKKKAWAMERRWMRRNPGRYVNVPVHWLTEHRINDSLAAARRWNQSCGDTRRPEDSVNRTWTGPDC